MRATGSLVHAWLLVEVHGAWGEDAIHESELGRNVPRRWKDELHARGIRAVSIRQRDRPANTGVRLFHCIARRPGSGPSVVWRRDVDGLDEVVGIAAALDGKSPPEGWAVHDERVLMVCTNGRHDQCCANRGRPLIRALRGTEWATRLWECSHIGGDRFAPSLVALPDSIYFGRVEPDTAPPLLLALDSGRIDLAHFRGRTSYSLAEQAVEHFVRAETGVDGIDAVVVGSRREDGAFPVTLPGRQSLAVRVRRSIVSIADPLTCKGKPHQLVPRFTLESIATGSARAAPERS